MKTVYLVRHGESTENARSVKTYQAAGAELTDKGREQAHMIAQRVGHLPVQAIIASTMRRAADTAQVISEQIKIPVTHSNLFVEREGPSSFVGRSWADQDFKRDFQVWERTLYLPEGKVEDGENFADISHRAGEALAYLSERPEEHILVVTHGFFMRTLLAYLMFGEGLRPDEFRKFIKATRTDNTGVTVLTYGAVPQHAVDPEEERWMIRVYNDIAHLG